jgi:hypothetical protein
MTIYDKNLLDSCACFAVRKCIPSDWLNNRDQFLFPNDDDSKGQNTMGNDISSTVRSRLLLPNTDDQQNRQWTPHYFDYAN